VAAAKQTDPPDEALAAEKSARWLAGLSGLPWIVFLAGVIMVVPVLIWAPLIGGLCLGALLLQSGLMRQWVRRQNEAVRRAATADLGSSTAAHHALTAVEALPTRVRIQHSGWLLAGVLFLLAVQAAMLLVVLQLKAQESASSWTGRSPPASQATPKEDPIDTPAAKASPQPSDYTEQRK
jgi:hypothetical protein